MIALALIFRLPHVTHAALIAAIALVQTAFNAR